MITEANAHIRNKKELDAPRTLSAAKFPYMGPSVSTDVKRRHNQESHEMSKP